MTIDVRFSAQPSIYWLIVLSMGAGFEGAAALIQGPVTWLALLPAYALALLFAAGLRMRRGRRVVCPDCVVGEPHICPLLERSA